MKFYFKKMKLSYKMFNFFKKNKNMYKNQGAPAPGYQSGQPLYFSGYQQQNVPMGIPPPNQPQYPQYYQPSQQYPQYSQQQYSQPHVDQNAESSNDLANANKELEEIWELPQEMKDQHETEFYNRSGNMESELYNLQLVLIIDHSGSMLQQDEDGSGQGRSKGMTPRNWWSRFDNLFQVTKYLAESLFEYDKDKKYSTLFIR